MACVPNVSTDYEQGSVIRFVWAKGVPSAEIYRQMVSVYGETCLSKAAYTVYRWFEMFAKGRTSVTDEPDTFYEHGLQNLVKRWDKCINKFDLRLYKGRLSYLPVENYPKTTATKTLNRAQSTVTEEVGKDHKPRLLPSLSCPANMTENNEEDEEEEDAVSLGRNLELSSIEEGHEKSCDTTQDRSGNDTARVSNANTFSVNSESLLPPLEEPVPENWIQREDDYVLVYAAFQTHISSDAFVSPSAALDDGIIWLIILRKGVTRPQLLSFMLALEAGNHVNLPFVEMIPVHAFRLEPITEPGYLTVDGEVVDYGPIQAEVLNAVARVMTH